MACSKSGSSSGAPAPKNASGATGNQLPPGSRINDGSNSNSNGLYQTQASADDDFTPQDTCYQPSFEIRKKIVAVIGRVKMTYGSYNPILPELVTAEQYLSTLHVNSSARSCVKVTELARVHVHYGQEALAKRRGIKDPDVLLLGTIVKSLADMNEIE